MKLSIREKQKHFIILRAGGESFNKIAEKLKVSKPTLISWSVKFEEEIKNLEFQLFQELLELHSQNKKKKFEGILLQLERLNKEISERDLSKVSFKDLLNLKLYLENQLGLLVKGIQFISEEYEGFKPATKTISLD